MTMIETVRRFCQGVAAAGLGLCLWACAAAPAVAPLTPAQRCEADGGTWDAASQRLEPHCVRGNATQCEAAGGRWQRVCMLGTLACVKPYADAGQSCRSGRDCLGQRCLMDRGAGPSGVPLTGHCIANDNPCYFGINLENGQPVPTAVAD